MRLCNVILRSDFYVTGKFRSPGWNPLASHASNFSPRIVTHVRDYLGHNSSDLVSDGHRLPVRIGPKVRQISVPNTRV